MNRNVVVGLDLGSNKLSVAVGEVNPDRSISVLALGCVESSGLRRGSVVNIESCARSIDGVLDQVERISGIRISGSRIGYAGINVSTVINRATVVVGQSNREITGEDVNRAIQAARMFPIQPDRSILHIIPRQYAVDGYEGVIDPIGMVGNRLEVEVVIVTAATAGLQNMVKTVTRAGTKVQEIVLNSVLASEVVLQPAEMEIGVALVDIGGGTCEIAIFDQGSLAFASVLPIGGDYITRDLAVGLRTTMDEAKRVKENFGFAVTNLVDNEATFEVASIYGKDKRQVSQLLLASIIQPRVEEILELLELEITRAGYKGVLPAGVVLTGGTSLLKGIVPVCEEYLKMPVRLGYPENPRLLASESYGPECAAVLGNLLYGARLLHASGGMEQNSVINNIFARLALWFQELFR